MRYKLGKELKTLSKIMFIAALVTNILLLLYFLYFNYILRIKIFYIVVSVLLSFIAWVLCKGLYAIGEILIAQDEILKEQKKTRITKTSYKDEDGLLIEDFRNKDTDLDELVEKTSTANKGFLYRLKNNKIIFYTLIIACVIALGGGIYSKVKYDIQHEYDGIWRLGGDLEGDSFYIDGNYVSFSIYRTDNNGKQTLYQDSYRGERHKNYVTFTSYLYDYDTDYNHYKTKKIHKVIYLKRISYGAFDVDGKCYWKG